MSTTVHNDNKACCSVPPVPSSYQPKGTIQKWGGFEQVYITGPEKSDNAILCVFDIFGFKPQTQLGADMLASCLNTRVFMPDLFLPDKPLPLSVFPPKTDEDKQMLQDFFGGTANPQNTVSKIDQAGEALKKDGYKKMALYGLCWGGKVAVLEGSKTDSPFCGVATMHPAMLSSEDTKSLNVPFALYVSPDEPADEVAKINEIMSKKPFADKNDSKLYETMFHGWAAARSNLEDEENKKQFEDVYNRLCNFFRGVFA